MFVIEFVSIFVRFHVILIGVLIRIFIVIFCGGCWIGLIWIIRRIGGLAAIFGIRWMFIFLLCCIFFISIRIEILVKSIEGRVFILLLLFSSTRFICIAP